MGCTKAEYLSTERNEGRKSRNAPDPIAHVTIIKSYDSTSEKRHFSLVSDREIQTAPVECVNAFIPLSGIGPQYSAGAFRSFYKVAYD